MIYAPGPMSALLIALPIGRAFEYVVVSRGFAAGTVIPALSILLLGAALDVADFNPLL